MIPAWNNGKLEPVEKLAVHLQGLKHLAVSVFVMQGNKTLLQRRALRKYHTPGLWANTCCTHPHWDEDPTDCATRRLHQELGISGLELRRTGSMEYRAEVGNGLTEHEVVEIFAAEAPEEFALNPDPGEVMETMWIALSDLDALIRAQPQQFTPWLSIYLAAGWGNAALTHQSA
jgi:isopentenyl-diphosphate delta-isomerase